MDYRKITDKTAPQYYYRVNATTNSDGVREYEGLPLIAMGLHYGYIGDVMLIEFSTGETLQAIIGDTKGDRCRHDDGSMLEFIVDTKTLDDDIKRLGNLEKLYGGHIVNVWKQS